MPAMVENVNVAVVLWSWSMIIYCRFRMVVVMMYQTFSCYVKNVIGVNRITPIVKFITEKLANRLVKVLGPKQNRQYRPNKAIQLVRNNARVQPKVVKGVKTKPQTPMDDAIYIHNSSLI